jgi:hypothetical protein
VVYTVSEDRKKPVLRLEKKKGLKRLEKIKRIPSIEKMKNKLRQIHE